jgi:hypothetical protein
VCMYVTGFEPESLIQHLYEFMYVYMHVFMYVIGFEPEPRIQHEFMYACMYVAAF